MNAFVTGATGFVGAHLVRALLKRGANVRCLVRPASKAELLQGLAVEVIAGDLSQPEALSCGIQGVDIVYHCAADYRLFVPDPARMHDSNVEGTRNIMRVTAEHAIPRVVYTSTVGVLGLNRDGTPADETTPVKARALIGPYKRSKYLAERVVQEWAARGLPVVIVNPSTPVGEGDIKPTATGQMIVDYLNGKIGAYVETGLNLVDVRDVAEGHILAGERGRTGSRYILGHENLTLKQILDSLADITGGMSPRIKLPHWVPLVFASLDTGAARLLRRTPRVPLDAVRMSRYKMFFSAQKAVRELGMPQSPVKEALARAVCWFRQNGYAPQPAGA